MDYEVFGTSGSGNRASSNTDPALLAGSVWAIGVAFDLLITAADAGSYKPARSRRVESRAAMTSRFTEIVIDTHDLRTLADFWCAVLDYKIIDEDEETIEIAPADYEPGWSDDFTRRWKARVRAAAVPPTIVFARVPEPKTVKNRVHVDVSPVGSHDQEVERLLKLGATKADIGQGDVRFAAGADIHGAGSIPLRLRLRERHENPPPNAAKLSPRSMSPSRAGA